MNIGIKIVERKPIVEGSPRLVCGNKGDTITFYFDSEWSNYTAKVARFVYVKNGVVESPEVLFNGNVAEIPVLSNITEVFIGVYAGDLRTTTPVTIPCDFSILCKGGKPVDPTPDIYAQILDALNAKLILEGNASSATKLETPRTIQVDLANSNGASFDGTTDVTPGVKGVLPKEYGGTGTPTPELIFAPHGVKRVTGSAVTISDSNESPLANLKLFGKKTQPGTPTPENPIDLVSVGDSGSFEVGVYGEVLVDFKNSTKRGNPVFSYKGNKIHYENTEGITNAVDTGAITLPAGTYTAYIKNVSGINTMVIGVAGLYMTIQAPRQVFTLTEPKTVRFMISTNNMNTIGSYDCYCGIVAGSVPLEQCPEIDEDLPDIQTLIMPYTLRSVGDIKDEVDFVKGVFTENSYKKVFNGTETIVLRTDTTGGGHYFMIADNNIAWASSATILSGAVCNRLIEKKPLELWSVDGQGFSLADVTSQIRLRIDGITTVAELQAKLKEWYAEGNPLTIIAERATPIETPLTETELNAYRQLHTNKPNTTIVSEADLEVDYYTDTLSGETLGNLHSSLYSEIETLKQAIVSLGGEV